MRDRSFAGLFPYASNAPMKVFAGNQPAVPVSVLVDALDTMQGGGATKGQAEQMRYAAGAKLSACQSTCQAQYQQCAASAQGSTDAAKACHASAQSCAAKCPMV